MTGRRGGLPGPLLALLLASSAARGAAPAPSAPVLPRDPAIERVVGAVYPALVNLSVVRERFVDGRAVRSPVAGSGVVVTPEGHLLTNHHVAVDAVRIRATLSGGEQLEADVVAHDPPSDLSVLRLRAGPERRFAAAALGDSDALAVGQPVLALGNPFVLASSVTLGIVSNPRRVFTDEAGSELLPAEPGGPAGLLTSWIQHDALILPGSSGGPLIDLEGQVVGINELGGQGLGFAIPASVAVDVLAQVLAVGEVRRSWIGATLLPAERRRRLEGALVAGVVPGSPAAAAGLRAGDLLLRIGELAVAARLFEEIPAVYRAVAALPSGVPVEIAFERGGELRTAALLPQPLEPARGREGEIRRLGLTAQEITGPMARERGLEGAEGLLVTGVRPASPAARARPRLEPGDVLLAAAGEPVGGLDRFARRVAERGEDLLPVAFRRGRESILAVLSLASREEESWGVELPRAWLGVRTQVLAAELAAALDVPSRGGFRVTEVLPATAAARAGLRAGDLILSLDGEPLAARRLQESDDLRQALAGRAVGERVRLGLWRDGQPLESEVALEAEPRDPAGLPRTRDERLELVVRDLALFDRHRLRLDESASGALVAEVPPGGWADLAGVRTDDLVLAVDGRAVSDAAAFARAAAAPRSGSTGCLWELLVERNRQTQILFVEPIVEEGRCAVRSR